jgi:hypothetical protein
VERRVEVKKLFLIGVAALLLATGAAHAAATFSLILFYSFFCF